jgi:hypothetical protein
MCLGAIVERRPGSPDVAAVRSLSRISSQYAIAANRIVLALAATICVASMSHAQSGSPKPVAAILPDVALLIQGPFGEYSYKLTMYLEAIAEWRPEQSVPAATSSLPRSSDVSQPTRGQR